MPGLLKVRVIVSFTSIFPGTGVETGVSFIFTPPQLSLSNTRVAPGTGFENLTVPLIVIIPPVGLAITEGSFDARVDAVTEVDKPELSVRVRVKEVRLSERSTSVTIPTKRLFLSPVNPAPFSVTGFQVSPYISVNSVPPPERVPSAVFTV